MRVCITACLAVALSLSVAQAAKADLLAFWNFNNTRGDDADRLNANGFSGGDGGFDFMFDNNPNFDDGWYDQALERLYPSHDSFENYGGPDNGGFDPGALVDETAFPNGVGVPSPAVVDSMFKTWINVSDLVGDGSFTNSSGGNNAWGSFAGTALNEPGTAFSGGSLSPIGSAQNGRSFTIEADLTGFEDIELSWAQRGTGTGYNSRQVAVSTDGVNFTDIPQASYGGSGTLSSTFTVQSADFGSLLDNATTAYIRFTLDGATSTNGNNRFDNFVLEGTASVIEPPVVPEPGMMLVFGGLAVVFGAARRLRG